MFSLDNTMSACTHQLQYRLGLKLKTSLTMMVF